MPRSSQQVAILNILRDDHCSHPFCEGWQEIAPGDLGENVLTQGLDVLALSRDTLLHTGVQAVVRITGLRNPGDQIEVELPAPPHHALALAAVMICHLSCTTNVRT